MQLWLILALIVPMLWPIVNIIDTVLRKRYFKDDYVVTFFYGMASFLAFFLIPFVGFSILPLPIIVLCLFVGILNIYAVIPYFKAITKEETSRVVALWFIMPVALPFLAFFFLGEKLSAMQYLGFFLVVLSGAAISIRKHAHKKPKLSKVLGWMLISGVIFNVSVIILKYVYTNYNYWHAFLWVRIGVIIGAFTLLLWKKNRAALASRWKSATLSGFAVLTVGEIIDIGATILYTIALAGGPVTIITGLGNFQPLFLLVYIVLLAKYFPHLYKEEITRSTLGIKLVSILIMLAGLWMIGTN